MQILRERAGADTPAADGLELILGAGEGKGLCIYTKADHRAMLERLAKKGESDRDFMTLRKDALQTQETQKLDAQNRVRIPQLFAKKYSLSGEIVMLGSDDHIEVVSLDTASSRLDRHDSLVDKLGL